ncbi:MAG TPA: YCF48-related protein, partial [Bacteroidia bacterium]|nr:YCF48-related protein [Bacteroidia bacterium]
GNSISINTNGYAVSAGSNGGIYASSNYGANWTATTNNVKPLILNGGLIKSATVAYVVGNGGSLYKSSDGGVNWKAIATATPGDLQDVGENNNYVTVCGDKGVIMVSNDVSAALPTWTNTAIAGIASQYKHIAFSGVNGYITSSDGKILTSSDYGNNWSVYHPGTSALDGLFMQSESLGYAVGSNGNIIKITPAPAQSLISAIHPARLNDTHCEGSFALAVGNAVIMKSEDGGQSWDNILSPPSAFMRAVGFVKPEGGETPATILVAGNGVVLRSTDGGTTFTTISSPAITVGTNISAICMTSEEKVYAVGDNGVIRNSTDGGLTWKIITSPVSVNLTAITIKGDIGFITGENGTILKSENVFSSNPSWTKLIAPDGDNWVKYSTHINPAPKLNSVYFHDYTTGYVAGDQGVVLKTKNGGVSWEQLPVEGTDNLNYISFHSNIEGTIFGSNTTVLSAIDYADNISTRFYYDRLGRLVASQNTKQYLMSPKRFSYTRYDEQNRIIETGEVAASYHNLDQYMINADNFPDNISNAKYTVKKTFYDVPLNSEINGFFGAGGQENLRSRVSTVTIQEEYDPAKTYDHATHYSYDAHGNIKSVIQDNPELE